MTIRERQTDRQTRDRENRQETLRQTRQTDRGGQCHRQWENSHTWTGTKTSGQTDRQTENLRNKIPMSSLQKDLLCERPDRRGRQTGTDNVTDSGRTESPGREQKQADGQTDRKSEKQNTPELSSKGFAL